MVERNGYMDRNHRAQLKPELYLLLLLNPFLRFSGKIPNISIRALDSGCGCISNEALK